MDSPLSLPTPMATPMSQVKPLQLQRDTAPLRQPPVDPRNASNLLRKVFKKGWDPLPTAQKLHTEHAELLLDTPIGRDFTLITVAGVEFQVHSIMLIGGSKALQEGLFPGGAMSPNRPGCVNLPAHFHPILVDRIVNFIYTSDYRFLPGSEGGQLKQTTFKFYHATLIPNEIPPSPATVALVGIAEYAYHLHIYALAEELDYNTLRSAAHAKLVELLVFRSSNPEVLKEAIKTILAPTETAERICKDEDGALQQLVVAAVLAQEAKHWTEVQVTGFLDSIQDPAYEDFRKIYTTVKEDTGDLIKQAAIAKHLAAERKKGRERRKAANSKRGNDGKNRIFGSDGSPMGALGARPIPSKDKFKQRYEAKRGVTRSAKADKDGDMDMEVD
ncbi:hypothetical protein AG0111_0g11084 [Alternaria gaisen]|uniref:Uncharacterized protein n=1 Tax=Alternaria gaisen TaxID=167740 RepID=A0ACB6F9H8_9PLEO|nr:hypothetical protein AG0111_0g11084 [Alternaria gaisen]